jgi:phosphoglycerate dehydrogenase-like enzyme
MQILIAEDDHLRYAALLGEAAPELDLFAASHPEQLAAAASHCDVWLGQPDLLAALLRQGHRPEWAQSTWAGITPLLAADLPRDYRLSRAVGIFGQVMAEYVLTYLLAHERRVFERAASQSGEHWDNRLPNGLAGRCALIVGTGEIGTEVARLLQGFGLHLLGIAHTARPLEPFVEVATLACLGELAGQADYLINLLPDTPGTCDVFDARLFAGCQRHALFINAGRGVAVVDDDLVAALREGRLAGAVIDVCREEPLPPGHPFWTAPNLLLTGHTAAPTLPPLMAKLFLENLQRYRTGEALRGEVTFARGY